MALNIIFWTVFTIPALITVGLIAVAHVAGWMGTDDWPVPLAEAVTVPIPVRKPSEPVYDWMDDDYLRRRFIEHPIAS